MAWTRYQTILGILMVVTGTFNTLSMKWADKIKSKGADGKLKEFGHPFLQAVIMFIGEITCLIAFKLLFFYYKKKDNSQDERTLVRGNRDFNSWIFFLPALCDVLATSVMYVGLTLTYASSFQMLRGSLIIFVALLSIVFLGRKIVPREWVGIVFVISGLILVGISDFLFGQTGDVKGSDVVTGDVLIILSQIVTAIQVVVEEHFVAGKDIPPLQAVGLEGCFGLGTLGILLIPLYYIHVGKPISTNPEGRLEDLNDAFTQIRNNLLILVPLIGNAASISFFNFAGIGVTKELSGTTRTVLDSVRTFFIWAASLAFSWQAFSVLQVLGFLVLLLGIFVYNDVLIPGLLRKAWMAIKSRRQMGGSEPLLNQTEDAETG